MSRHWGMGFSAALREAQKCLPVLEVYIEHMHRTLIFRFSG